MPEVTRRRILEVQVAGKPLGRHVHHDARSLQYQVHADGTAASANWARQTPILDQGEVGSCTGNALTGALGSEPFFESLRQLIAGGLVLDESEALKIYSAAETIDGDGPYPPNDNGSSGLSVAKAAKNAGLINGYTHMTSVAACQTAIQAGPFIIGSDWYSSMDSPNPTGLVTIGGSVRGGHEYLCRQYDAQADLWWLDNSWGTSFGVGGRFCYSSATFAKLLANDGDATQLVPLSVAPPIPQPPPADIDATYWAASHAWALQKHTNVGGNKDQAARTLRWGAQKGFSLPEHTPEHASST